MVCFLAIESARNDGVKGSGLVEARERRRSRMRSLPLFQLLPRNRLDEENGSVRTRWLKTFLRIAWKNWAMRKRTALAVESSKQMPL